MTTLRNQLADALRAEASGVDLQEGPYGIHVIAQREDGTLYELGSVSECAVFQDPAGARAAISRIKFWPVVACEKHATQRTAVDGEAGLILPGGMKD